MVYFFLKGKHGPNFDLDFLAQLPCCAYTITFRKPFIASLEIWMIGLWMVGLLGSWKSGQLYFGLFDPLTII